MIAIEPPSLPYPVCLIPPNGASGRATTPVLTATVPVSINSEAVCAISKLLVNWADIIGNEIAKIAKPVKVNYGRDGIGAGLVLLTNGANAPIVQAQSKQIIDRVNEVYGYNAISRVRITQTDPGELINENSTNHKKHLKPSDLDKIKAKEEVNEVKDDVLKIALQSLGANILAKSSNEEELK